MERQNTVDCRLKTAVRMLSVYNNVLACLETEELTFHEIHDDGFSPLGSFEAHTVEEFVVHDRSVILIQDGQLTIKTFQV